jgi:hypothetical protein
MTDNVNHPSHYTSLDGVECIDTVRDPLFCLKTAWVYLWRYDKKGTPVEDLKKAQVYIQWALEQPWARWIANKEGFTLWHIDVYESMSECRGAMRELKAWKAMRCLWDAALYVGDELYSAKDFLESAEEEVGDLIVAEEAKANG